MKKFAYELAPFPSCCQASIVHGMYEEGFVKNDLDKGSFIGRLTDYGSYMKFAITADHQGNAICDTLRQAGFEPVHTYRANTGSVLTAWMFKPADQPENEPDFDAHEEF